MDFWGNNVKQGNSLHLGCWYAYDSLCPLSILLSHFQDIPMVVQLVVLIIT